MLRFLDLSHYNAVSDWAALAAAYDGVLIQATFGGDRETGVDARWATYWAAAQAHGLLRLAYHYLYPQYNTPEREAANFLAHVTLDAGDGWAVDVEEPCADPAAASSAFMQLVEQALQAPRNWYSFPAYIARYGITAQSVGNPHLWLASYRGTAPPPPPGWASIALWQRTSSAVVPGVVGPVDEDVAFMTRAQFATLCKPALAPQEVNDMVVITPAVVAAARARLSALGHQVVPGGAIETELIARYALGQANPRLGTLTPTPVVGSEVALPDGRAFALLDSGELLAWEHGRVDNPEAKDHAALITLCGWSR
jgi:GH25 family lysozyme M1 (1,4-beta-N-acetylmuramidase)